MPDNFTDLIISVASEVQFVIPGEGCVCSGIHYKVLLSALEMLVVSQDFCINNLANMKCFLACCTCPMLYNDIGLSDTILW